MRIISKKALLQFAEKHPEGKIALLSWHKVVKSASWDSFADIRLTFRTADIYQDCVIFNVGGNKFRVIAKARYRTKRVYIRFVLTHSDYDKNSWKEDCEC